MLEAKKAELRVAEDKERAARTKKEEAERKFKEEAESRAKKEEVKEKARQDYDEKAAVKKELEDEARELRKKKRKHSKRNPRGHAVRDEEEEEGKSNLHAGEDDVKEQQEYLSTLSDDELKKEMSDEAREFAKERKDLMLENLDPSDQEDLAHEVNKSALFVDQIEKAQHAESPAAKQEALERVEELGEQNEVFLEDLHRDAKINKGHKWKEGKRPRRMEKLAKQIDTRAEVLRSRVDVQKLAESSENLEQNVVKAANTIGDPDFANRVSEFAESLQEQETSEKRDLEEGEDDRAYRRAKALEEFSQNVQQQVAELERITSKRELSPEEKREHDKVLNVLEKELVNIENEAQAIEKGLERRAMRHNAVEMSKDVNELAASVSAKGLKHSDKVVHDVTGILGTESKLITAMKDPAKNAQDVATQDKLAEELQQQNEELEDDARHLYDEANAANFGKLDEKLDAQRVAQGLRDTAGAMDQKALDIEHDESRREIRDAAQNVDKAAQKLKGKPLFAKVQPVEEKVMDDARVLDNVVAEENWDEEATMSDKTLHDIVDLEKGAEDLEKELAKSAGEMTPEDIRQYKEAILEMRGHAESLKKLAQGVKEDVKHKAKHEGEKLKEKLKPLLKLSKFEPVPKAD